MTAPAPSPAPAKRSKRMVVWLVAVPIVILLLALAGANWKRFHLAYAKHLIASDDINKHLQGINMVLETHLRGGMSIEEVRRLLAPASVIDADASSFPYLARLQLRPFVVAVEASWVAVLGFDRNDRLRDILTFKGRSFIKIPLLDE